MSVPNLLPYAIMMNEMTKVISAMINVRLVRLDTCFHSFITIPTI